MWAGALRVAAATVMYGLVHSALASSWAKDCAVELVGRSTADAFYRPFFNAQALVLLALLVVYARRQPVRDLYDAKGPLAWAMRAGQAVALGVFVWAVASVGLPHLTGYENILAWSAGGEVPAMPDGQEPAPAESGAMKADGPLAYSRHPLNWLLIPLFWLQPRMTTRLLAFNLVLTAYVVAGSVAAEAHTLRAYGEAYQGYQARVPFVVGVP
jgi:protein-S-isoprenylcysteine O-methyltransferase Ste14